MNLFTHHESNCAAIVERMPEPIRGVFAPDLPAKPKPAATRSIPKNVDAYDLTRDNRGYGGMNIPKEWERVELSVRAGRKISVYVCDGVAMLIRSWYGANSWDTCDSWLKNGEYTRPNRGPKKVYDAIVALGKRIQSHGLTDAVKAYGYEYVMCCCCGATLTDQASRIRRIGPVCVRKIEAIRIMKYLFGG